MANVRQLGIGQRAAARRSLRITAPGQSLRIPVQQRAPKESPFLDEASAFIEAMAPLSKSLRAISSRRLKKQAVEDQATATALVEKISEEDLIAEDQQTWAAIVKKNPELAGQSPWVRIEAQRQIGERQASSFREAQLSRLPAWSRTDMTSEEIDAERRDLFEQTIAGMSSHQLAGFLPAYKRDDRELDRMIQKGRNAAVIDEAVGSFVTNATDAIKLGDYERLAASLESLHTTTGLSGREQVNQSLYAAIAIAADDITNVPAEKRSMAMIEAWREESLEQVAHVSGMEIGGVSMNAQYANEYAKQTGKIEKSYYAMINARSAELDKKRTEMEVRVGRLARDIVYGETMTEEQALTTLQEDFGYDPDDVRHVLTEKLEVTLEAKRQREYSQSVRESNLEREANKELVEGLIKGEPNPQKFQAKLNELDLDVTQYDEATGLHESFWTAQANIRPDERERLAAAASGVELLEKVRTDPNTILLPDTQRQLRSITTRLNEAVERFNTEADPGQRAALMIEIETRSEEISGLITENNRAQLPVISGEVLTLVRSQNQTDYIPLYDAAEKARDMLLANADEPEQPSVIANANSKFETIYAEEYSKVLEEHVKRLYGANPLTLKADIKPSLPLREIREQAQSRALGRITIMANEQASTTMEEQAEKRFATKAQAAQKVTTEADPTGEKEGPSFAEQNASRVSVNLLNSGNRLGSAQQRRRSAYRDLEGNPDAPPLSVRSGPFLERDLRAAAYSGIVSLGVDLVQLVQHEAVYVDLRRLSPSGERVEKESFTTRVAAPAGLRLDPTEVRLWQNPNVLLDLDSPQERSPSADYRNNLRLAIASGYVNDFGGGVERVLRAQVNMALRLLDRSSAIGTETSIEDAGLAERLRSAYADLLGLQTAEAEE